MLLKNQVAIVTGASRGIGRAIALELASEGTGLILAARTVEQLQAVVDEIVSKGGKAIAVPADVSTPEDVKHVVSEGLNHFGRIDILVNNAGAIARCIVSEMSVDQWDEILSVNVRGTFLCSRAVLGTMLKQKKGDIFNISSNRARQGKATRSAYCASKAAIRLFAQSLREEVKSAGIRVHTLILAGIDTPMIRASYPETSPSNWIDARHVGKMIAFCASLPTIVDTPEIELRSLAD